MEKGTLYILHWTFKKIPFTLYTYVLAKILQNGIKFLQRVTSGFENHKRNLNNFIQAVESPKSWNLMGFCPKNIYLIPARFLQIEHLSKIIFNYLCENSSNYLFHFWNHKSFLTTQLPCILLAQTLHTFYKSSPSKCKFSSFSLIRLKFTKFLMSFFK